MKLTTLDLRRHRRLAEPAQPEAVPSARGPGKPELRVVPAVVQISAQRRTASPIRHTALTIAVQEYGKTVVLVVDGVVDLDTAPMVRYALATAVSKEPRRLIVDLSLVQFLNSAGLQVLLAAHRQAGRRTDLRLVATTRAVWRPLQLSRLHEQLVIHTSLEEALAAPARRESASEATLRSVPPPVSTP